MKNNILLLLIVASFGIFSCAAPKPAATTQPSIVTTAPQVPKKLSTWYQDYFKFYNLQKMKDSITYFYNTAEFVQTSGSATSGQTTYQNGEIVTSKIGVSLTVKPLTAGRLIDVEVSGGIVVRMIMSFEPSEPKILSTFAFAADGIYYLESIENGIKVIHRNIWLKVSFYDMKNVREITASGWNNAYPQ